MRTCWSRVTAVYEQELRCLIFSCKSWRMEYVEQLKDLTPAAQWPELFEQILRLPSMRFNTLELLAWEGQFQRLYDLLSQRVWLDEVDRYESALRSWSPEKTRDLYSLCLDREMGAANERSAYRKCVERLRELRTYPDGEAAVSRLVKAWRERYPRHRAMLDELDKAGY